MGVHVHLQSRVSSMSLSREPPKVAVLVMVGEKGETSDHAAFGFFGDPPPPPLPPLPRKVDPVASLKPSGMEKKTCMMCGYHP